MQLTFNLDIQTYVHVYADLCNSGKMTEMNGETAAVAVSLIVVLIMSIIFMYTIGFVSGHCFTLRRMKHSGEKMTETSELPTQCHGNPAPEYECIQANASYRQPKLKQNVAYGPIHSNQQ